MQAESCRKSTLLSADPETCRQQLSVSTTDRQTVTHTVTSIKCCPAEKADEVLLRNVGVFKLPEAAEKARQDFTEFCRLETFSIDVYVKVKVKQSHYRPGVAQSVRGSKVPRFQEKGTGWW